MTAWALAAALLVGALDVSVQPATPSPGDPVLVRVAGAVAPPSGTLGAAALSFYRLGDGYAALAALPVEQAPGPLTLSLAIATVGGEEAYEGDLEVRPEAFRRRTLTVSKRFTRISRQDKAWAARDRKAYARAFSHHEARWRIGRSFAWPRPNVQTAPFGDVRLFNGKKKSQHYGLDLDGAVGDVVTAANDGVVVMVRSCFGSGNTVLLHHGGSLFTAYFHLSAFAVKEGDEVRQGQKLGLVGATGRITGPHLHWGVKLNGRWVNPATLMALDFGGEAPPDGGVTPDVPSRDADASPTTR